ncbi:PP2C family protein-serine/threonine phosphatase [Butyrivibrio sp. AC2005]|uniref:PP2C family protein-serine/threonine phosphatase n=1 Tax=Butyrivibrio sp. AC2005 TaxID=1280672 RepID=UPI00040D2D0A|nr:PP2C family protein-serine/threonine phosphatase [Butyrivibrio sp. AC2005]
MELLTKKQKNRAYVVSVVYIFLVFICAQLIFIRGINNLKPIYVFNISGDIFGMLMGAVLFICCLLDVQKTGSNLKWLFYLLNTAYIGLFTDAIAWLVDGVPELSIINYADNFIYYICGPLELFCFWKYTESYLQTERRIVKLINKFQCIGLVIALFIRVSNFFNHIYYYVTKDGVYHRSQLYLMSVVYVFSSTIATMAVVIIERKNLERYQIATFFMYALSPFVVSILTIRIYGISIIGGVIMLVILLMYCILNVLQGRDKAIADRDLSLASSIQEHMLPRIFPPFPDRNEFDLYASMTPAKEVGGDFYDFFMIDDNHLAIVIADVSGKGVPAALFMMVARTIIKNQGLYSRKMNPCTILKKVNNQLCEGNDLELFVTTWLGILNISDGTIDYANAGHEYPCIRKDDGEFELLKEKHSPPLAALEGLNFRGGQISLSPGDAIFIYTDGVTEATDAHSRLFGEERMLKALNMDSDGTPMEIDRNVRDSISRFVKDAPQFDDITMLCLKYYGTEKGTKVI